jgi:hypothetical protein
MVPHVSILHGGLVRLHLPDPEGWGGQGVPVSFLAAQTDYVCVCGGGGGGGEGGIKGGFVSKPQ